MNRTGVSAADLSRVFQRHHVSFAYLFGSKAKGLSHARSDRDIAVHFDSHVKPKDRLQRRLKIWNGLSDLWPGETIDLVVLEEAPLLLRFNAIRDGQLLYCANDRERIWFEVPTMKEYFDRQYYVERGAQSALKSFAKRGLRD